MTLNQYYCAGVNMWKIHVEMQGNKWQMINEKMHDNIGVDGTGIEEPTLLEGNTTHVKA